MACPIPWGGHNKVKYLSFIMSRGHICNNNNNNNHAAVIKLIQVNLW